MKQTIKSLKYMNREERGRLIYKSVKIVKTPSGWRVPSQMGNGQEYLVKFGGHKPKCSCPDCQVRKKKCKHIFAVEFYIKREITNEGKIKETKGIKVTYAQKWRAYDKSQTNEKLVFMKLLRDLCDTIEQPKY